MRTYGVFVEDCRRCVGLQASSFKFQDLSRCQRASMKLFGVVCPQGSTHHLTSGPCLPPRSSEEARNLSSQTFLPSVLNENPGLERTTLRNTSLFPASLESKVSVNFYRHISTGVTMWSDSSEPRRSQTSKRVCKTFGSEVPPFLAECDTAGQ